jgi:hypothetical protein
VVPEAIASAVGAAEMVPTDRRGAPRHWASFPKDLHVLPAHRRRSPTDRLRRAVAVARPAPALPAAAMRSARGRGRLRCRPAP